VLSPPIALALLLAAPGLASAATFTVNTTVDAVDANPGDGVCETAPGNSVCTLRAAILEANALPGADVITLPAGTYLLTLPGGGPTGQNLGISGDLEVNEDLTINGAGTTATIVDASDLTDPSQAFYARAFDLRGGSTTVNDVTIRGGHLGAAFGNGAGISVKPGATLALNRSTVSGNDGGHHGSGIYAEGALTVTDSTISNNMDGSGIYALGQLRVARSTISQNMSASASNDPAGIFVAGNGGLGTTAIIEDSDITANIFLTDASGGPGGIGGSDFTILRSRIMNNSGCPGGGIVGTDFDIVDSVVSGNYTRFPCISGILLGGGITGTNFTVRRSLVSENTSAGGDCGGAGISGISFILVDSTVANNTEYSRAACDGGRGAGIHGSGMRIANSTISDNKASGGSLGCLFGAGAGVLVDTCMGDTGAASVIRNSTIAKNGGSAGAPVVGGGLYVAGGSVVVRNSIIYGNTGAGDGTGPSDCAGLFIVSEGYNLVGSLSGCTLTGDTVSNLIGADPLLAPLGDWGGGIPVHALLPGSAAIDAGDSAGCIDDGGAPLLTDERGAARPWAIGGRCDIGAYETGCGNGFPDPGEQCDDGAGNGTDGCCSATCGVVDLDGDGICNRDDPVDARITVTKAKVRRSTFAPKPNGGIAVNGAFLTSPPADTFSAASGISVRVQDGGTLNSLVTWSPSDCSVKPSGLFKCQTGDHTKKGTFKPIAKALGQWAFTCSLRKLGIAGPFIAPVSVDVMHGLAVDRVGSISLCTSTSAGLTCRLP
jgi:CSLREA domain-containing protein